MNVDQLIYRLTEIRNATPNGGYLPIEHVQLAPNSPKSEERVVLDEYTNGDRAGKPCVSLVLA